MKEDIKEYLYHYCSLQTAIEYILPTQNLLLNPLIKTNDPRESNSYNLALQNTKGKGVETPDIWEFNEEIAIRIRKSAKLLCFCTDNEKTKGFGLSRMWALYGGNHKGICLQIDKSEFVRKNEEIIKKGNLKKIDYDTDLPAAYSFDLVQWNEDKDKYLEKFRIKNLDVLFFMKNDEWRTEYEERLLVFSDKKENEFCTIDGCLESVIIGIDFNMHYLPSIEASCNSKIKKIRYWNTKLNISDL